MPVNVKLAIKVLKEMEVDFLNVEASLAGMPESDTRTELFKQVREKRLQVASLKDYYLKILTRQP